MTEEKKDATSEVPGLSNYVVIEMMQLHKLSVFLLIESIVGTTSSILRCNVRNTIRLDNPEVPDLEQLFVIEEQSITLQFDASGYILDIGGGGEGAVGQLKGEKVVAIDVRKEELEEAPAGPLKIVMDARDLRFLDLTFETVTAFFSLMYIPGPEREKVMREVFRVLTPGGRFLIWDVVIPPRGESMKEYFVVPLTIVMGEKETKTAYGVKWEGKEQNVQYYVEMAERSGFEIAERKEQGKTFYIGLRKK